MRWFQRKSRSTRKANRSGLMASFRRPAPRHAAYGPLPELPPGSMPQRPATPQPNPLPPVTHTYQGGLCGRADLDAVAGRVKAGLRPAFHIDLKQPLFRDGTDWKAFDAEQLERERRSRDITKPWPDGHGVNLGDHHGPKTLVFSTSDYGRFSDGTDTIPAVKR